MDERDSSGDFSSPALINSGREKRRFFFVSFPALINSGREKRHHGQFLIVLIRLDFDQDKIRSVSTLAYTMKWMHMLGERFGVK